MKNNPCKNGRIPPILKDVYAPCRVHAEKGLSFARGAKNG
jgi:hypothetical protein